MSAADIPAAAGPSARFWDRIADRYARRPVADEAAYQRKLKVTQEHLKPDMEVLEFGCGTGSTALVHASFVRHIEAIDISAKMIEIARRKAAVSGVGNVTFRQASFDGVDAADGAYDVVLGLSILHLLEDRDAAIAKVRRLLKPGGLFISSTACLGDTLKIFKVIGPIGRWLGVFPLVRVFTRKQLETSLTANGFVIDHAWQPGKGKALFVVAKKR